MADLSIEFAGIKSPNPSGWHPRRPPTRPTMWSAPMRRAGVGWSGRPSAKTRRRSTCRRAIPRTSGRTARCRGSITSSLITDRSLEINLREIAQVKKDWPDRALIVSLMVPCVEESWKYILPLVEATGADGIS